MRSTDTLIIGGGQAGLAMSRCLQDLGIDHVVLERGRIAERWRSERWDSLRLLTPNWQTRLPGFRYSGPDPDGFMSMPELIDYLERYARTIDAPVETGTSVLSVEADGDGYRVLTDRGSWRAAAVVVATGACGSPLVPEMAGALDGDVVQLTPTRYRNPSLLPPGGVLVVGASASGIQLADEIHRSGRQVTLAVGRHVRLPRSYRGRDIMWWLDAMGVLDRSADEVHDLAASRAQPSLQLVGRSDRTLDLATLQSDGVRLVGRAVGADGGRILLCDDLAETTAAADAKLARLLERIDAFVERAGLAAGAPPPAPVRPVLPAAAPSSIDLAAEGIRTVLWATGFRPSYPWLRVPVLDDQGQILHRGGVTAAPGLYVIGLSFLRRRKSTFIDGVGADAADLAAHIAGRLGSSRGAAA